MQADLELNDFTEITSVIVGKMLDDIKGNENETLREMAKVVKANVETNLNRSDIEEKAKKIRPKNYDGSRPYKHMKDDVRYTVTKDKNGDLIAKIYGGKHTGYKWKFLNDGTLDENGKLHTRATHFIDKALEASKEDIKSIVDDVTRKVVK